MRIVSLLASGTELACALGAGDDLYFNRSSPSLFATLDVLTEVLHPETFRPTLEGSAWQRWPV